MTFALLKDWIALSPTAPGAGIPVTAPAPLASLGSLEVKLASTRKEVRRAQRLRYKVFFEQGNSVPDRMSALRRRDLCAFDEVCDHLIVVDHDRTRLKAGEWRPTIVGTYRLLRQAVAERRSGFYSAGEFDLAPLLARHPDKRFAELGRACVLPAYRSRRTIELLWRGIWAYTLTHRIDVLFGCASLEGTDLPTLAPSLAFLRQVAGASPEWQAEPRPDRAGPPVPAASGPVDRLAAMASLPPLLKGYIRAGARFANGAVVDRQFGTTDVLAILPVTQIDRRYLAHFGGAN